MITTIIIIGGIVVLCFLSLTFGFAIGKSAAQQDMEEIAIEMFDKGRSYERNAPKREAYRESMKE